ncbi:MoaD/ThiS family protein [Paramaledivibacter caminithermalis]|jgi:molybdopterin synthase sulfur carrier subunit|uniref:Molybdopterin synthase sulfur carrier subunit n=1 Tax=Paramaledivibacter caminithermalis (strain DSM 15212 / CIP 107654 / DViRD3) TaxID=1121301 RepID=A0A1M6QVU5_PARC5|nr:MoaD/ThiS family protein [Paramaledivibacter caminithermalis]SHK24187.1 molybdopterin synthase sulfur carrier subunit [Paramaledivibacter caminithermalis DSM 15212]
MINVKFFGLIRLSIKTNDIDIEANTVNEALKKISQQYEVELNALRNSIILVNDKNIIHLKMLKTRLYDGDEIKILSAGGGG